MPNRENRPSKFSAPTSSRSTARRGGSTNAGVKPIYDYQEGTADEGAPKLAGFEDTTPAWQRFLRGVAGIQGPDISGLNAQLALGRDQSERAFTQAKELEGIRSTADLTKLEKEFELRKGDKGFDHINNLSLEQEKAKLAIKKAVLDNDLKAQAAAEEHSRKLAEQQDQAINTVAVARGLTPAQVVQGASTWMQQATEDSNAKQEASKAAGMKSKVEQGIEASRLGAIGGIEGKSIPRSTALSSVTEPMLAAAVANDKNSRIVLQQNETGFGGGYGEKPTTVYTPGRPGTPSTIAGPGTPPVDPSVRTLKDPDAIRAEMESLKRAAASSRYPVSRYPVAAGQFWDAGNQGVVAGRVAPQTTTAVAPQESGGFISALGRAANSVLQPFGPIGQAGYSTVRGLGDLIYRDPEGSPEREAKLQNDAKMYNMFQKWRNSKVTDLFDGQPAVPQNSTAVRQQPKRQLLPEEELQPDGTVFNKSTGYRYSL